MNIDLLRKNTANEEKSQLRYRNVNLQDPKVDVSKRNFLQQKRIKYSIKAHFASFGIPGFVEI